MRRIVVGVDGSAGARHALQWAAALARETGAEIEAVCAWHYPVLTTLPVAAVLPGPEEMSAETMEHLRTLVRESLDEPGGLVIRHHVSKGPAAEALLEAAMGADLLVVGSRGLGGFGALLLGSVSQQVTHHAPCPVVIVPPPA